MPGCCVVGCRNRSEKGFRLFRLPTGDRNTERREEWLRLIGKDNVSERSAICEVHFDDAQFETKREDGRKLLHPFAKPNLLQKHIKSIDQSKEAAIHLNYLEVIISSGDKYNIRNINENSSGTN